MRIRPVVIGAVAAVSMWGAACGNPENTGGDPAAPDTQRSGDAVGLAQAALGLGAEHSLVSRNTVLDELGQTHTRYEHLYRGVRVFGGDTVVHTLGTSTTVSGLAHRDLALNTSPKLTAAQARAVAHAALKPQGPYTWEPTAELVIVPTVEQQLVANPMRGPNGERTATDFEPVVKGYALAYYVRTALENGTAETKHTDYLIDANNGSVLESWDSLKTTAASGTGNSQHSGTVTLNTNSASGVYEMRDVVRTMNYATYNLNHLIVGTGTIYTDADNTWGDGQNYIPGGSTTSANGQTAAVDAHYGMGKTYDYYFNVYGRNGIDGAGKATYNRVHYSTNYANVFWDDTCGCMTFGDGDTTTYKVPTALDVIGHEMAHGVTSRTANLVYSGEPGGINESMSDINGTMLEFYARGGSGSTIGNTGGTWTIGEQITYTGTPLRYMCKPSKDGISPNAWSSSLGSLDPHYSSGPHNRMFCFLSQGASSTSTSDTYSSYLPGGMTGIGNDHAARIAYRALTAYMTSSTNYSGARNAYLAAASSLYGSASADYAAVQNAFAAINVGAPASSGGGGLQNGGFESGNTLWTATTGAINNNASLAHAGSWEAYLCGYGTTHTDTISQTFTLPATATTLSYWQNITTSETTTTTAFDTLTMQLKNSAGTVVATQSYSNLNKSTAYGQKSISVSAYAGQTVTLVFTCTENASLATSFFIDDVTVN